MSRTGQQPLQTGPALPSSPTSLGLKRDQAPATIRARSWESSSRSCWPHWSLTSFTQADMSLNLDVFTSFKYLASDPKSPCMKDWLWFWWSWLRPCYSGFTPREGKHPGLLIRHVPLAQDWACTSIIVPELATLLHWQRNQSSPTHFLGILFPIPLFWSSCCSMFVKV